jgi:hypothetical protein
MFVGRILSTGKQPLNGRRQTCPESGRLRDNLVKSTTFALVLT